MILFFRRYFFSLEPILLILRAGVVGGWVPCFSVLPLNPQAKVHLTRRIPIVADVIELGCFQVQSNNVTIGGL